MYVVCMSVRRGCWCRMLDVDSTNYDFFQNRKENTIILNERRIWAVESLSSRRRKLDILSNSTKTSDLQKVNFLDTPAIFTNLLHNCDIRNRTTIEKQFSIGHTCDFYKFANNWDLRRVEATISLQFASHLQLKPESRQTSHNSFWYKPREINLSSETIKTR